MILFLPLSQAEKLDIVSMLCKVSLGFLFLLTAVSFLAFTAVAANKTKQPSNNMVSQVAFCEEHACYK